MKNYASDYEPSNARVYPDVADIHALGLSSRYGKTKSRRKRATRRYWNKLARRRGRATPAAAASAHPSGTAGRLQSRAPAT